MNNNPYQEMWDALQDRVKNGKTGWGKNELLAVMREIEIGTWRGNYAPSERESEMMADLELDKAIDNGLMGSAVGAGLSEADIVALEAELDKVEDTQ